MQKKRFPHRAFATDLTCCSLGCWKCLGPVASPAKQNGPCATEPLFAGVNAVPWDDWVLLSHSRKMGILGSRGCGYWNLVRTLCPKRVPLKYRLWEKQRNGNDYIWVCASDSKQGFPWEYMRGKLAKMSCNRWISIDNNIKFEQIPSEVGNSSKISKLPCKSKYLGEISNRILSKKYDASYFEKVRERGGGGGRERERERVRTHERKREKQREGGEGPETGQKGG